MGRSTPVRALYCSKCKAKWSYMYARSNYSPTFWRWFNVEVIETRGQGVLCRCNTCGHEYVSRGRAAYARIAAMKAKQQDSRSTP